MNQFIKICTTLQSINIAFWPSLHFIDYLISEKNSRYKCMDELNRKRMFSHYDDVIMRATASQITSLTIVCSTVYLDTDHKKHQSSASLAFVRGNHRKPVNSPHKWPVTRKMLIFDDVIMIPLTVKMVKYITVLRKGRISSFQ